MPTTTVDGILVQLPLPPQLDEARVIRAIEPVKDVDGLHPVQRRPALPRTPDDSCRATPLGIMALLAEHRIPLEGAEAVVIGPQRHRRQADRPSAAAGERDRDDLPLAHVRPCALHARGRRAGRRRSARPRW